MVEVQTPWVGDGLYVRLDVRRPCERAASAIVSLFDPPGGVAFSYLVIKNHVVSLFIMNR